MRVSQREAGVQRRHAEIKHQSTWANLFQKTGRLSASMGPKRALPLSLKEGLRIAGIARGVGSAGDAKNPFHVCPKDCR
jgi:hypothetical protein